MKRYSYCGAECADDAVMCPIDQTLLNDPVQQVKGEAATAVLPAANQGEKTFPEHPWSARDGWKFLGMILVFELILGTVEFALYLNFPQFHSWRQGASGRGLMAILIMAMNALTAACFARTKTFAAFCEATGLNRKPTNYAWTGVAIAFVIQLAVHVVFGPAARNYSDNGLIASQFGHGMTWYLLFFTMLATPFWNEPVMRGFVYKAFRGSYPAAASVLIVLAFTLFGSWNRNFIATGAIFSVIAITVVECYLREKSESIWDCILCHLMFNGSFLFFSSTVR